MLTEDLLSLALKHKLSMPIFSTGILKLFGMIRNKTASASFFAQSQSLNGLIVRFKL